MCIPYGEGTLDVCAISLSTGEPIIKVLPLFSNHLPSVCSFGFQAGWLASWHLRTPAASAAVLLLTLIDEKGLPTASFCDFETRFKVVAVLQSSRYDITIKARSMGCCETKTRGCGLCFQVLVGSFEKGAGQQENPICGTLVQNKMKMTPC